jgi:hypothetical protein
MTQADAEGRSELSRAELRKLREEFIAQERERAEQEGRPFPPAEAFVRSAKSPTFLIWNGIKRRVAEGRISAPPEWLDDVLGFEHFVTDVGQRPSEDYRLERMDSSQPLRSNNCQWVPRSRRPRSSPISSRREAELRLRKREELAREFSLNPEDLLRDRRLLARWTDMCRRCNDAQHPDYPHYGGRGIKVCREWDNSNLFGFEVFKAYLIVNLGLPLEDMSIDRIDVNGDYEPGNIQWGTAKEQRLNQRRQGKQPPEGWTGGRRATEEARERQEFLRRDEAKGPPLSKVHRVGLDDDED